MNNMRGYIEREKQCEDTKGEVKGKERGETDQNEPRARERERERRGTRGTLPAKIEPSQTMLQFLLHEKQSLLRSICSESWILLKNTFIIN